MYVSEICARTTFYRTAVWHIGFFTTQAAHCRVDTIQQRCVRSTRQTVVRVLADCVICKTPCSKALVLSAARSCSFLPALRW